MKFLQYHKMKCIEFSKKEWILYIIQKLIRHQQFIIFQLPLTTKFCSLPFETEESGNQTRWHCPCPIPRLWNFLLYMLCDSQCRSIHLRCLDLKKITPRRRIRKPVRKKAKCRQWPSYLQRLPTIIKIDAFDRHEVTAAGQKNRQMLKFETYLPTTTKNKLF